MTLKITFVKLGTNSENAVTGDLTLLDDTTVIKRSIAFSGGNAFNPLDDGKYNCGSTFAAVKRRTRLKLTKL